MGRTRSIPLLLLLLLACTHSERSPGRGGDPTSLPPPPTGTDAVVVRDAVAMPAPASDATPPDSSPTDEIMIIRGEDPPSPPAGTIPTVRTAPTTVGPAYPPSLIRRVVRRKAPEIRACYQTLLTATPAARGRGHLRFTIDADGHVAGADMDLTAFRNDPFVGCVLGVLRALEFPRPPGGGALTVTYPLVFIPAGEPLAGDLQPP